MFKNDGIHTENIKNCTVPRCIIKINEYRIKLRKIV